MAKKSVYLEIPQETLLKWKQLWQPKDAWELSDITGFTDNTVRAMIRRGTAPNEKVIREIDEYYDKKIFLLSQLIEA